MAIGDAQAQGSAGDRAADGPGRPVRILVVCTGNICRSPMAEVLTIANGRAVGLDLEVVSAGVAAVEGPADHHAIAVMADAGLDLSGHRAQQLSAADVEDADLVLTMTRAHVIEVVGSVPSALHRTFTLPEFVERARALGPRPRRASVQSWIAAIAAGRDRTDMLRSDPGADVDDPYTRGRKAFVRCAARLDELVWAMVDLMSGAAPEGPD